MERKLNYIEDESLLAFEFVPLLQMSRDFRKEPGSTVSIPSVSIFGDGIKTIADVSVIRDCKGKFQYVDYLRKDIGDGSALEQSAFLPGSDIHPLHQHHSALFVDKDVRMRLKLELT
jgi:hypothetical protein